MEDKNNIQAGKQQPISLGDEVFSAHMDFQDHLAEAEQQEQHRPGLYATNRLVLDKVIDHTVPIVNTVVEAAESAEIGADILHEAASNLRQDLHTQREQIERCPLPDDVRDNLLEANGDAAAPTILTQVVAEGTRTTAAGIQSFNNGVRQGTTQIFTGLMNDALDNLERKTDETRRVVGPALKAYGENTTRVANELEAATRESPFLASDGDGVITALGIAGRLATAIGEQVDTRYTYDGPPELTAPRSSTTSESIQPPNNNPPGNAETNSNSRGSAGKSEKEIDSSSSSTTANSFPDLTQQGSPTTSSQPKRPSGGSKPPQSQPPSDPKPPAPSSTPIFKSLRPDQASLDAYAEQQKFMQPAPGGHIPQWCDNVHIGVSFNAPSRRGLTASEKLARNIWWEQDYRNNPKCITEYSGIDQSAQRFLDIMIAKNPSALSPQQQQLIKQFLIERNYQSARCFFESMAGNNPSAVSVQQLEFIKQFLTKHVAISQYTTEKICWPRVNVFPLRSPPECAEEKQTREEKLEANNALLDQLEQSFQPRQRTTAETRNAQASTATLSATASIAVAASFFSQARQEEHQPEDEGTNMRDESEDEVQGSAPPPPPPPAPPRRNFSGASEEKGSHHNNHPGAPNPMPTQQTAPDSFQSIQAELHIPVSGSSVELLNALNGLPAGNTLIREAVCQEIQAARVNPMSNPLQLDIAVMQRVMGEIQTQGNTEEAKTALAYLSQRMQNRASQVSQLESLVDTVNANTQAAIAIQLAPLKEGLERTSQGLASLEGHVAENTEAIHGLAGSINEMGNELSGQLQAVYLQQQDLQYMTDYLFNQAMQVSTQGVEHSQEIMQLQAEFQAAKDDPQKTRFERIRQKRELEAAVAAEQARQFKLERGFNIAHDAVTLAGSFVGLLGKAVGFDPRPIQKAVAVGHAAITMGHAALQIFRVCASSAAAGPLAPFVAFMGAASSIVGIFTPQEDPQQRLQEMVSQLGQHLDKRFDRVEELLGVMDQRSHRRFDALGQMLTQMHAQQHLRFDRLEQMLNQNQRVLLHISHVGDQIWALLRRMEQEGLQRDINGYHAHFAGLVTLHETYRQTNGVISAQGWIELYANFLTWTQHTAMQNSVTGGALDLSRDRAGNQEHYLARLQLGVDYNIRLLLQEVFPEQVETLPNPFMWAKGSWYILSTLMHVPPFLGPEKHRQDLEHLMTQGKALQTCIRDLRQNDGFFTRLFQDYRQAVTELLAQIRLLDAQQNQATTQPGESPADRINRVVLAARPQGIATRVSELEQQTTQLAGQFRAQVDEFKREHAVSAEAIRANSQAVTDRSNAVLAGREPAEVAIRAIHTTMQMFGTSLLCIPIVGTGIVLGGTVGGDNLAPERLEAALANTPRINALGMAMPNLYPPIQAHNAQIQAFTTRNDEAIAGMQRLQGDLDTLQQRATYMVERQPESTLATDLEYFKFHLKAQAWANLSETLLQALQREGTDIYQLGENLSLAHARLKAYVELSFRDEYRAAPQMQQYLQNKLWTKEKLCQHLTPPHDGKPFIYLQLQEILLKDLDSFEEIILTHIDQSKQQTTSMCGYQLIDGMLNYLEHARTFMSFQAQLHFQPQPQPQYRASQRRPRSEQEDGGQAQHARERARKKQKAPAGSAAFFVSPPVRPTLQQEANEASPQMNRTTRNVETAHGGSCRDADAKLGI